MKFDEKYVLEGVLGVPSHQKWHQERPRHQKFWTKGSKDGPKETKRDPQIGPRGAKGRQMEAKFRPLGSFWVKISQKKDPNVLQLTPIMKIYEKY